ncbi:MAG: hypothetical protein RLZZ01_101 [Actinomycetota bacterium]|jgi:hypothetical protein
MADTADDRPVFEIELTGPDGRPTRTPTRTPTGPRRSSGRPLRTSVGALIGVAGLLAIGVAIAPSLVTDPGDDESSVTATTVPVLPTLPRPVESGTAFETDTTIERGTNPVFEALEPPRTALSGGWIVDLESPRHTTGYTVGSFVLSERSVDALDDDLPRRSTTDHVVGADGFRQRVVITNDPSTRRWRLDIALRLEGRTTTASIVVDLATDVVWLPVGDDEWTTLPGEELARRAGVDSVGEFVRRLQLGPLRSDTRPLWSGITSAGLVEYPGEDDPLAEWTVTIDAGDVPFWSRYALGPLAEAAPLPDSTPVEFTAYVTSTGVLRRVTAETDFGATTERIDHHVVVLDDPVRIDVPIDVPTPGPVPVEPGAPDTTDGL